MTEEEFAEATHSYRAPLNEDTSLESVYGDSLAANIKYTKHLDDDGEYSYYMDVDMPEEVQCVPCGIKFKTEKYSECPNCKEVVHEICDRNRKCQMEFMEYEGKATQLNQDLLKVKDVECRLKNKLVSPEDAEKEIGALMVTQESAKATLGALIAELPN